eukprot:TRINITY_DN31094_c0_g1_i2.p1 TRINITY_DN31094_c0_g1~~TRINITY_DN31094_c0_g1_i2.p1  ORF type:complete len:195 (-),score=51.77 TRINITY_DN31094_c0_g1_i2:62-646(-)
MKLEICGVMQAQQKSASGEDVAAILEQLSQISHRTNESMTELSAHQQGTEERLDCLQQDLAQQAGSLGLVGREVECLERKVDHFIYRTGSGLTPREISEAEAQNLAAPNPSETAPGNKLAAPRRSSSRASLRFSIGETGVLPENSSVAVESIRDNLSGSAHPLAELSSGFGVLSKTLHTLNSCLLYTSPSPRDS